MSGARRTREAGFSLLEMLIGTSLLMVLLAVIAMALEANHGSNQRGESRAAVQRAARHTLGSVLRELRMAGYFPENFATPPVSPALTDPIQIATHDALAIYGDLDGSGTSHVFLYCLDGTRLRRGKAPLGDATAYWCPAGEVVAEGVTALRFDYHDGGHAPIPAAASATFALDGQAVGSAPAFADVTQRGAVRRVTMTMTLEQEMLGRGPVRFSLGSEVQLRNAY